jgi:hypothetical protein
MLQYAFTQYSLKQGLKKFPVEAKEATMKEIKQLRDMHVFKPVHKSSLTKQEIQQALGSIIFIKEKRCGRIKAENYQYNNLVVDATSVAVNSSQIQKESKYHSEHRRKHIGCNNSREPQPLDNKSCLIVR